MSHATAVAVVSYLLSRFVYIFLLCLHLIKIREYYALCYYLVQVNFVGVCAVYVHVIGAYCNEYGRFVGAP